MGKLSPRPTPLEEFQLATRSLIDVVLDHVRHDPGTRAECQVCQAVERARMALLAMNRVPPPTPVDPSPPSSPPAGGGQLEGHWFGPEGQG